MDERSTKSVDEQEAQVREYYVTLYRALGPQHWWPGKSRFEVIVGAILVQNTAWRNVELALDRLRAARALSVAVMRQMPTVDVEALIRPAGFFRQKAKTLKRFLAFLEKQYRGCLSRMFAADTNELREQLLAIRGIGPETADSILLYAGQHPVFVVDSYARRILSRHEIVSAGATYDELRRLVEASLAPLADAPPDPPSEMFAESHPPSLMSRAPRSPLSQIYNEMHGLAVHVGKHYCLKSVPRCEGCPLQRFLPQP